MAHQPSTFRRFLWPYARPHKRLLVVALFLNAFSGVAISLQTLAPKYFIDDILLNPHLDGAGRIRWAVLLGLAFLLVTVIWRMLLWHWSFRIFTRIREAVLRDLRSAFFRHINSLCLRFHVRHQSGELFSYLFGTPLTQVQLYFHQVTMMGPHCAFNAVSTLVVVLFWDPVLTAIMFVAVGTWGAMMWYSKGRAKALSEDYQEIERSVSGRVADLIRGTRHVKLYAIEDDVESRFRHEAENIAQQLVRRDVRSHEIVMAYETLNYVGFAALLMAGAWRFSTGHVQVGEMAAYLSAYAALGWPMNVLFQIMQARGGAEASLGRMAAVMDTLSSTPEPEGTRRGVPPAGAEIRFDQVSFRYTDVPVISDLNLVIPYGQSIALVGPSGSGKSTISQLMLRLYDPHAGTVSLGGVNLRTCSGRDVRRLFGIVPQQPYFFRATVLENVRLLKPSATPEEVWQALEQAQAAEFVRRLDHGLDTLIGEEGSTLSGGQRQRLAIARALLASPSYFIFDEATSALDTVSEKKIQETLRAIIPGKTAVIIAHRLATIRHCERILVLHGGRIVQDGTYEQLIAVDGPFAEMARQHEFAESE